jgi:prephenate dehydratase
MEESNDAHSGASKLLHYLGPPGTYSHQVALELRTRLAAKGGNPDTVPALQPCSSITATLAEANARKAMTGQSSWALLPFENNSNGPVVDSYEMLFDLDSSFQVVEEYYLPVSHSLLCSRSVHTRLCEGQPGGKADLRRLDVVSSHSQVSSEDEHTE